MRFILLFCAVVVLILTYEIYKQLLLLLPSVGNLDIAWLFLAIFIIIICVVLNTVKVREK